ncbi:MAG: DUF3990 domain-containing protein [Lachnospiraceae bacterium]|nr:DUF3990 domain-containing protein [Lachnospiraceae bacterium]
MRLYHGSSEIVDCPEYGKGKLYNDYGRGFYCTDDIDLAREWAVDANRDGFVNCYELDDHGLEIINLNSDEYCVLHWITILLQNRRFELDTPLSREAYRFLCKNYSIDVSRADVIKGYRADDSYFSYAQDFVSGQISVVQLAKAMKPGDLGEQTMIRSQKAFDHIKYSGCEGVAASVWYARKMSRDRSAREAYHKMNRTDYRKGELYIVHIIEEEVTPDDPRLR